MLALSLATIKLLGVLLFQQPTLRLLGNGFAISVSSQLDFWTLGCYKRLHPLWRVHRNLLQNLLQENAFSVTAAKFVFLERGSKVTGLRAGLSAFPQCSSRTSLANWGFLWPLCHHIDIQQSLRSLRTGGTYIVNDDVCNREQAMTFNSVSYTCFKHVWIWVLFVCIFAR